MSEIAGKSRQKSAADVVESDSLSLNERILKDCHSLYTDAENGLIHIAASAGLSLLAPRKKISVMLIGNHSAGKSSFVNWYVEEHVQRTGVAIEQWYSGKFGAGGTLGGLGAEPPAGSRGRAPGRGVRGAKPP